MGSRPLFPKVDPAAAAAAVPQPAAQGLQQLASQMQAATGVGVQATRSNGTLLGQSVSVIAAPPGPNAFEVGVIAYDPDSGVLNIRIKTDADAEEIEATMEVEKMTGTGTVELLLGSSRLSPRIDIVVHPRVKPPKFSTPEEADAWLEAHA